MSGEVLGRSLFSVTGKRGAGKSPVAAAWAWPAPIGTGAGISG